ncbi:MAG: hypothetical protein L3J58_13330 [Emcibacter sp.]|nr:hypothetical protein [Emcibacter sp.]
MKDTDDSRMEILFARMGYALLGLSGNNRVLVVSLIEKAAECLREDYVEAGELSNLEVGDYQKKLGQNYDN